MVKHGLNGFGCIGHLVIRVTFSSVKVDIFFFFFLKYIYLFIYFGCVGSSLLCEGSLQLRRAGATLHRGAQASHRRGLSHWRAQAPDVQAQQLWLMGLAAPRHVGSSWTGTRTHVPCIGRRTPNHCATREARILLLMTPSLTSNTWSTCSSIISPMASSVVQSRLRIGSLSYNGKAISKAVGKLSLSWMVSSLVWLSVSPPP